MWVHAYQSHVWNSLACSRIRLLGAGAVPGDLLLPDDNGAGTTYGGVTAPRPPEDGKDVLGAESTPSSSELDKAGGINDPSGVGGGGARGDGAISGPAKTAAATATAKAGEPSRPAAVSGRAKGAVCVLTREMMESLASQGVTPRDLLRRVVLPLAGTSVQYPHHGVSLAADLRSLQNLTFSVLRAVCV